MSSKNSPKARLLRLGDLIADFILDKKAPYPRFQVVNFDNLNAETAPDFFQQLSVFLTEYKTILVKETNNAARVQEIERLGFAINRSNGDSSAPRISYAPSREESAPNATNLDVRALLSKLTDIAQSSEANTINELLSSLVDQYESAQATPKMSRNSLTASTGTFADARRRSVHLLSSKLHPGDSSSLHSVSPLASTTVPQQEAEIYQNLSTIHVNQPLRETPQEPPQELSSLRDDLRIRLDRAEGTKNDITTHPSAQVVQDIQEQMGIFKTMLQTLCQQVSNLSTNPQNEVHHQYPTTRQSQIIPSQASSIVPPTIRLLPSVSPPTFSGYTTKDGFSVEAFLTQFRSTALQYQCSDQDRLHLFQSCLKDKAAKWLNWYLSHHGHTPSWTYLLEDFRTQFQNVTTVEQRYDIMRKRVHKPSETFQCYILFK